jgi:NAD(P)-dependent dehydrogenase (short-subunit alcohol dehydrogenase family)
MTDMKSLKTLMNLKGRVALITGGAGHIGSAIAETLAELGAQIGLLDVSQSACEGTATKISRDYNVETLPLAIDLTDEKSLKATPEIVVERFGRLDILVNCAALVGSSELEGWIAPFEKQSSDSWRLALEVNLTAPFVLVQACAKYLKKSGRGSIVNIGSIYGIVAPDMRLYAGTDMGNPAAYAASKGGLQQLTRWLSSVMAPDVRVNSIAVGGVRRHQPDVFQKRYAKNVPLKRMAIEEDIKGAVAYLASDASAYVTGHSLVVDGGWTVW